jgi:hypothetical protein
VHAQAAITLGIVDLEQHAWVTCPTAAVTAVPAAPESAARKHDAPQQALVKGTACGEAVQDAQHISSCMHCLTMEVACAWVASHQWFACPGWVMPWQHWHAVYSTWLCCRVFCLSCNRFQHALPQIAGMRSRQQQQQHHHHQRLASLVLVSYITPPCMALHCCSN